MIETALMDVLVATPEIRSRISAEGAGDRIYLGRVPQGVPFDGGVIVVKRLGRDRDYGLARECGSQITTIQIDCLDVTPHAVDELADMVALVLAGDGETAGYAGPLGDKLFVESIQIAGERTEYRKPLGASDAWRPRDSRDYRIHHSSLVSA